MDAKLCAKERHEVEVEIELEVENELEIENLKNIPQITLIFAKFKLCVKKGW